MCRLLQFLFGALRVKVDFSPLADVKEKPKKKGKSENPFSFKKFLSSSSTNVKPSTNRRDISDATGNNSLPNIASDLPDFVQDHFCDAVGASARGLELPDFAIVQPNADTINRDSRASSFNFSANTVNTHQDLPDSDNEFDDEAHHLVHVQSQNTSGAIQKLPDFLSDGAYSGSQSSPPGLPDSLPRTDSPFSDRDAGSELHRVRKVPYSCEVVLDLWTEELLLQKF